MPAHHEVMGRRPADPRQLGWGKHYCDQTIHSCGQLPCTSVDAKVACKTHENKSSARNQQDNSLQYKTLLFEIVHEALPARLC